MDTASSPRMTAMLLTVGGLFGTSFLLVHLLVARVPPAQITAWRMLFGAAAVTAIIAARGGMRVPNRALLARAAVLATLDGVIPNTLLAWAQLRIDSGVAALLISSMPLFTVVIALGLPGSERLTGAKAAGLALGMGGVTLVVGADANGAATGAPYAHAAVLLASLSNAVAVVYARSVLAHEDPLELSGVKLATGAALAFTVAVALGGADAVPSIDARSWALLVVLGFFANGVGRTMYLSLIATAGSTRASLVAYIVPAVGVLLGCAILDEVFSIERATGLAMIALGVAFVMHGPELWGLATRLAASGVPYRRQRHGASGS